MEAVEDHGPRALGVRDFSATEATKEYLESLEIDPLARFRASQAVPLTQGGRRHPPFEFLATLPPTQSKPEAEAIVLLQDAAGEDLMKRDDRIYRARSLLWSDVVLFVYNPEDAPGWPSRRADRPRQAALLNGIRNDLEMRLEAGSELRFPPLIIAVSKVDLLKPRPQVMAGDGAVMAAVEDLGDASMIAAAGRWPAVHWRFIAPQPKDGSGQEGVTELFAQLLSVIRP
jgi:hypothetical protein